jgi:hypothetical protein
LVVGVDNGEVFGFVEGVDVFDFKIHAFFKQHKAATVAKWAGDARIECHHRGIPCGWDKAA